MFFSYSPFSSSASSTSSASSSASSSPTSSPPSSIYHATSPYQSSSAAMPISPCAYPSWPTRASLSAPSARDPYAHTTASSYISDADLFDDFDEPAPAPPAAVVARQVLDTAAIRDLLEQEAARKKARKSVKVASSGKSRRRGSGGSEKKSASARLSPIAEGSWVQ